MEKKDTYNFDIKAYRILRKIAVPFVKSKFNFKRETLYNLPDEPFILISNHVTNLDMVWIGYSIVNHLYFVSSEHVVRKGLGGKLLNNLFHPIVREKGTVGLSTVVEMKKCLQAGHNVGLFAEGVRSADGLSNKIVPSTAAVVKKLGYTLVTFRIHGGFFTSPRWASDIRKGEMSAELVHIYTPNDLKKMSSAELDEAINRDIFEDAYSYNSDKKIAYKSRKAAEGIEFELVMCPKCRGLATIKSQKNRFFCDCGLKGVYNEYGMLSGEGFGFSTIPEWDKWQKNEIFSFTEIPEKEVLISHPGQTIREINRDHEEKIVGEGDLVLTGRTLSVGDKVIELKDISGYDIFFHGYLLIFTKDKKYYEISDKKIKYPGYLYKLLLDRCLKQAN
ncbi:MAG: 1-acyl-sn-glycerol-3-phosphate acyltransferase [Lachnospiraceae bacterium]|nr:1-acyl-sn-glycerol-3-phosphate acyltransferase [Lachnospiraceae bacterium]